MTAKREQPSDPGLAASPSSDEQREQVERDIGELLADVERERDEYLELARRTKADFENYRKRIAGEAAQAEKRGRADIARQLVPVLDNLERALASSQEEEANLAEGVRLVYEELSSVLERNGIESYEPAGEPFDPEWHEAMMTRPASAEEAGKVLDVLEKGYRLDGQVLRPARVVVGKEENGSSETQPARKETEPHPSTNPSGGSPPDGR
jgi:molecular chaperone GrpE